MNFDKAIIERPKAIEVGGVRFYTEGNAATYLGLTRERFKRYRKRHPAALPFLVLPVNGYRAWREETLDTYREKWLTPQPEPEPEPETAFAPA